MRSSAWSRFEAASPINYLSAGDPDARARQVEAQMTPEERAHLTHGVMALPLSGTELPKGAPIGAGFVQGIPRLSAGAENQRLRRTTANSGRQAMPENRKR